MDLCKVRQYYTVYFAVKVYIAKYVCIIHLQYFRDENMETLERAAEEKQKIHASMKEADERVKEMTSTIAALKVCDVYMHDLVLTLQRTYVHGMETFV